MDGDANQTLSVNATIESVRVFTIGSRFSDVFAERMTYGEVTRCPIT
jgi:hypothetical protein